MTRAVLACLISLVATLSLSSCLSADPFFFNSKEVDGYDWDAEPPDPDLEGDMGPAHPSTIGPDNRIEGFIEPRFKKTAFFYLSF